MEHGPRGGNDGETVSDLSLDNGFLNGGNSDPKGLCCVSCKLLHNSQMCIYRFRGKVNHQKCIRKVDGPQLKQIQVESQRKCFPIIIL